MKKQWIDDRYYVKEKKNKVIISEVHQDFYYVIYEKNGQKVGEIVVSDRNRVLEEVRFLLGIEKTWPVSSTGHVF